MAETPVTTHQITYEDLRLIRRLIRKADDLCHLAEEDESRYESWKQEIDILRNTLDKATKRFGVVPKFHAVAEVEGGVCHNVTLYDAQGRVVEDFDYEVQDGDSQETPEEENQNPGHGDVPHPR